MNNKSLAQLILLILVIGVLSCRKETAEKSFIWNDSETIITYRMEFNAENKLIKSSKFVNDELNLYTIVDYSDSMVVTTSYDNNFEKSSNTVYKLDLSGRATNRNYFDEDSNLIETDTIIYYSSGFIEEYGWLTFTNNGENITGANFESFLYLSYSFTDTLVHTKIPYDLDSWEPSIIDVFGESNKHLLHGSSRYVAGPPGSSSSINYKYILDSEGRVIEMKKYSKDYPRHGPDPTSGTVYTYKYEYVY
ncbi:MAG: hypothetical protein JXR58_12000 [Bacteroidales bacterium]|nr:hypothetical protein [Bacteroidales bacterium]